MSKAIVHNDDEIEINMSFGRFFISYKRFLELCKISERLDEEIKCTQWLNIEGDPFLLSRRDYYDNLKMIRGDLQTTKEKEGQP